MPGDERGVAGDGSGPEGGSQGRQSPHQLPHQKGRQHMHELANHLADEMSDEFASRKSLVLWGRAATPPPADGGDVAGEAASDPSLPTT